MTYNDTIRKYSFLWSKSRHTKLFEKYHFNAMQEILPEKIVTGSIGLDLGCGSGEDTFIMAKNNPSVRIIGMDISEGAYVASRLSSSLKNAIILRGTGSSIPLKNETCDFVYSFGVLHHMHDYKKGLLEIFRVLKKRSPFFLYLYEDHTGSPLKYVGVKIIAIIRKITVKIPPRILYVLSYAISPVLVLLFSYPAKIFKRFKLTYGLYEKTPFNFGHSLFSLKGDIYDRFATPTEIRFNPRTIYKIFSESGFTDVKTTKLKARAGWVVWGYKKDNI